MNQLGSAQSKSRAELDQEELDQSPIEVAESETTLAVGVLHSKVVDALSDLTADGSNAHADIIRGAMKALSVNSAGQAKKFMQAVKACDALGRSTIPKDARETLISAVLILPFKDSSLSASTNEVQITNVIDYLKAPPEDADDEARLINQTVGISEAELKKKLKGIPQDGVDALATYLNGASTSSITRTLQNQSTSAFVKLIKMLMAVEIAEYAETFYGDLKQKMPDVAENFGSEMAFVESYLANNLDCVSTLTDMVDRGELAKQRRVMGIGVNMLANIMN